MCFHCQIPGCLYGEALEEEISGISRCILHVKGELSRNNSNDPQCERTGKLPALPLRILLISSECLVSLALGIGSQRGSMLMKLQNNSKVYSEKKSHIMLILWKYKDLFFGFLMCAGRHVLPHQWSLCFSGTCCGEGVAVSIWRIP